MREIVDQLYAGTFGQGEVDEGLQRMAHFLQCYNAAVAAGQGPIPIGAPLSPSEQGRVERFLSLADPRALDYHNAGTETTK